MKTIPLTRGKEAIVDDEDFEMLSKHKWLFDGRYAKRSFGPRGSVRWEYMHRVVAKAGDDCHVDHKNGIKLDNRRANLRRCSKGQNSMNRPKSVCKTSSRYKGVYWRKAEHRWHARIKKGGQFYSLGLFRAEREAAIAYNNAARQHFGEFAHLNDV